MSGKLVPRGKAGGHPEPDAEGLALRYGSCYPRDQPVTPAPPLELTPAVHRFVDVAQGFCAWVEHHQIVSCKAELRELVSLLAQLVSHGVQLPHVEPKDPSAPPGTRRARRSLVIAEFQYYWSVVDPLKGVEHGTPPDLGLGDVTDDIGDIYEDVAVGLDQWQSGTEEGRLEAVWHWKFLFERHWGAHATSALFALLEALNR